MEVSLFQNRLDEFWTITNYTHKKVSHHCLFQNTQNSNLKHTKNSLPALRDPQNWRPHETNQRTDNNTTESRYRPEKTEATTLQLSAPTPRFEVSLCRRPDRRGREDIDNQARPDCCWMKISSCVSKVVAAAPPLPVPKHPTHPCACAFLNFTQLYYGDEFCERNDEREERKAMYDYGIERSGIQPNWEWVCRWLY